MKSAPFAYRRATCVADMLDLLARHGDDAKILAGGQSLVAAMNFRLARPAMLIDANGLAELEGVRVEGDRLVIGALTRHAQFHKPVVDHPVGQALSRVVRHVAHYPIRQRGTFGGSLAHADPASEWCLAATVLDAEMVIRSTAGERVVAARDFFKGTFTTVLKPTELLAQIRIPLGDPCLKVGFNEFSRRAGDFALAMALVTLRLDGNRIAAARLGLGGVADRAVRLPAIEADLVGRPATPDTFAAAALAASQAVRPTGDIHGTPEYRRDLVKAVVRRALCEAVPAEAAAA